MTKEQLLDFLEENKSIEWVDDFENNRFLFRNTSLDWYINDENRATAIEHWKVRELQPFELLKEINRGFDVEGIARVTGYWGKVKSFNKGKVGELKDRNKHNVG